MKLEYPDLSQFVIELSMPPAQRFAERAAAAYVCDQESLPVSAPVPDIKERNARMALLPAPIAPLCI